MSPRTHDVVTWVLGVVLAIVGGFVTVEGAMPPHSFPMVVAGLVVVLLGGFVIPNDAIRTGATKLVVVATPVVKMVVPGAAKCPPPTDPDAPKP